MKIVKIEKYEELKKMLYDFDAEFNPKISDIVKDFDFYINKLYENAMTIVVNDNENNILGFCSFYCNDKKDKIAYISEIAVKKEYRNQNIGKKLMNECIKYCVKEEMKYLKLEVYNENINAQNFYLNNGFKFLEDKTKDSKIMQKRI